ncbi:MAG TPA: EAL domain-containing protein [Clostridiales bacterium]|nr:EAL domain-containing protein [Clostridiales bacterium]
MRKYIRNNTITISSVAIMIISIVIGGFIYNYASNVIVANLYESLTEIAVLGAKAVENTLKGSLEVIETIAAEEPIKNPQVPIDEKMKVLTEEAERKGFARLSIADLSGNSRTTDGVELYVGDREYFKLAKEGIPNVSDPLISRVDNSQIVTFAVPIIHDEEVVGVLYSTRDIEFLSKITDEIKLGAYGRSFIVDNMGNTIAHEYRDLVRNRINVILDWDEVGYHKSMHDFFLNMQKNEKGAGQYIFEGTRRYAAYAKIPGTNWYFGISAPRSQIFRSINHLYLFLGLILVLGIIMFSTSQFYIRVLKKNLQTERKSAVAAIDAANLIIIGINSKGIIYEFNEHAESKLGYKSSEVVEKMKLSDIVPSDAMDSYDKLMSHINDGKSLNSLEMPLKSIKGDITYIIWNLNIVDSFGEGYYEIIGIDISERVKIEKELIESHEELTSIYEELYASEETLRAQYDELAEKEKRIQTLAYYDPLSGLPNRVNLEEYFSNSVLYKKNAALLFMDLDNFKFINDTFGHFVGDELLIQVSNKIKQIIGDNYTAARFGGDEFMVLVENYNDISEVEELAKKLLESFESSFYIDDVLVNISTSMGIALYPENAVDFKELLKCADIAMYVAKEAGRDNYAFFNEEMNQRIVKRVTIQNSMKKAIGSNEFMLYYQPQYHIPSGKIKGFEALLRWLSPEHGFISPSEFIEIAEVSGLIIPLGKWVLAEACGFIKSVIEMGYEDITVSVNVSVVQLKQDGFVQMVSDILREYELEPSRLELEITESVLMENIDYNLKVIRNLRELGVRVSLDDFGTGYSSLNYLRELPINIVKIDKSFIDNIINSKDKKCLTGTIISLAHDLGLEVVAEGVETEEQLEYLKRNSCDMVQGYLISKPLPKQEVVKFLLP